MESEWKETEYSVTKPSLEWTPDYVYIGSSVYGTKGPRYEVRKGICDDRFHVTLFLGNCGWKISDHSFDTIEQGREYCEQHCHDTFKVTR